MYHTMNIPDTNIRVLTEEMIDEEFPPKNIWEHYYVQGNPIPQIILKEERPNGKFHKVGGKFKIGNEGIGLRDNKFQ